MKVSKPYETNMNRKSAFLATCALNQILRRSLYFIHPSLAKSESYTKMCRSRLCASFHGITNVMAFMNFSQLDQKPYRFNFAYVSPSHPRGDHKKEISVAALAVAYHSTVRPKKKPLVGNIFKATDMGALYNLHNRSRLHPGTKEDFLNRQIYQNTFNMLYMHIHFTISKSAEQ